MHLLRPARANKETPARALPPFLTDYVFCCSSTILSLYGNLRRPRITSFPHGRTPAKPSLFSELAVAFPVSGSHKVVCGHEIQERGAGAIDNWVTDHVPQHRLGLSHHRTCLSPGALLVCSEPLLPPLQEGNGRPPCAATQPRLYVSTSCTTTLFDRCKTIWRHDRLVRIHRRHGGCGQ
jgi:hypothetical protein